MRKQISFGIAFMLLITSIIAIASAGEVEVEISTYANHQVTINILDPTKEEPLLYTFQNNSDSSGKAIFNFKTSVSKINIAVAIRKNGKIVAVDSFEGYTPVGQIPLIVLKETSVNTSKTVNVSTNQTTVNVSKNQTSVNATNITSNSVAASTNAIAEPIENLSLNKTEIPGNETKFNMPGYFSDFPIVKVVIYTLAVLGVLVIIVGIILFFIFRKKNQSSPKEIKVKKYSELKEEIKERNKSLDEKKIDELEYKIKSLQEEVNDIKNKKTKIKEVEDRIKKDMAELEKLKK